MNQVPLLVSKRSTGKHDVKQVRKEGLVPGVFYMKGESAIPVKAQPIALRPIVYTSETKIVDMQIEGESQTRPCFLKDVTFHPVTDKLLHFDLVGFVADKAISVDIPIVLKGQPVGVREGGILQHTLHRVHVHCLAKDLPTSLEIDVTKLALGKSIHIKDVSIENVTFNVPPESVIVSVVHPRVVKEETPQAAAAATTTAAPAAAAATDKDKKEK